MVRINKQRLIRLVGLSIAAIVSFMGFQRYQLSMVSGSSMQPTVEDRELVLIHKKQTPNRYDLVAFSQDDKLLVKRVIGVPGDSYIRSGNRLLLAAPDTADQFSVTILLTEYVAAVLPTSGVLKEDEYFVLGDALSVSRDSRTFGMITDSQLRGVVTTFD